MVVVPYGSPRQLLVRWAVAIMAVLTPEQELQLGSADLRFLLERQGIEAVHQRKLFTSGIDTLDKFSAFATGSLTFSSSF